MPTLFSLSGLDLEGETDGLDLADYLRGGCDITRGRFLYATQHGYEIRAVRTERYKWIRNFEMQPRFQRPAPLDRPHVKGGTAPLTELYDLEADPREFENLAESPDHVEIRQELDRMLVGHLRRHGDPILESPLPTPTWQRAAEDVRRVVKDHQGSAQLD